MLYLEKKKEIRVQLMTFRDGLQSLFGGKVRLNDILPAMECAANIGIKHMEFGGGARYQAPYFYVGEDPFECMQKMREAVGPDVILQILTRSISGVTLGTCSREALVLQAKLMRKHGTTWDRNFDFMNDVDLLIETGKPIVDAGMHHQACVAMMGMPFESETAHTSEFYINIGKRLLESDVKIDSICMKDASGTAAPKTVYETAKGLKKIMPPEMPLWYHTHDTASTAVYCYIAGIEGGVDGIDLNNKPMASGTAQPDVRSMAHALKGTGCRLDFDASKISEVEALLNDGMKDYDFNPVVLAADARVLGFPMPGGAIGPNVHMMVKAGIIDRYNDVLEEFPVVVEAGGAWTSVTPGSQQYWLQAFNNVLLGRWKKIDMGYGKSVLGYFGKTPLPSNPKVVKIASEQLNMPVLEGNPLDAAKNNLPAAKAELEKRGLPVDDKSVFLVTAAMVPGKNMDLNEGIKLLSENPKIDIPLKKKEEKKPAAAAKPAASAVPAIRAAGPFITTCTVEENGVVRTFKVTVGAPVSTAPAAAPIAAPAGGEDVFSPFDGNVPIVDLNVKVGDHVTKGQVVAAVEAMKAKHEVKSPVDGTVQAIYTNVGDEVEGTPIMTITPKAN